MALTPGGDARGPAALSVTPMFTVTCTNCGKRFRLAERHGAKLPPCPHCGAPLPADSLPEARPLRTQLKEELQRLASMKQRSGEGASEGPKLRVADRPRRRAPAWMLVGGLLLALALCCAGVVLWFHVQSRRQSAPSLPPEVQAALADARQADRPGREAEALAAWQKARQAILLTGNARHLQAELDQAEHRIRELGDFVRQRQAAAQALSGLLQEARSALQADQAAEARQKLDQFAARLKEAQLLADDRAQLEEAARQLQADRRLTQPAPATAAAPSPAARPPVPAAPTPSRPAQPAAPSPLQQKVQAVHQSTTRGDPVVVIDKPEDPLRWRREPWANPLTMRLQAGPGTGERFAVIQQAPGDAGKWVVTIDQQLDLRPYESLTLDVRSDEAVSISAAVWTEPGGVMFETPTQTVPKGGRAAVAFRLKGTSFKSQATNWQFGTDIKNPGSATRVSLFIYSAAKGPVRFRNVSLRKAGAK